MIPHAGGNTEESVYGTPVYQNQDITLSHSSETNGGSTWKGKAKLDDQSLMEGWEFFPLHLENKTNWKRKGQYRLVALNTGLAVLLIFETY